MFPTDRWRAKDAHDAACRKLGISGYWLRDARHSYAVRAARAGTPAELIAKQLGHVDATMVLRVYDRFMAESTDRDRWERVAAAHDEARFAELAERANDIVDRGQSEVPVPLPVPPATGKRPSKSTKSPNPLGLDDFERSRGGTRTLDPGIMRDGQPPARDARSE